MKKTLLVFILILLVTSIYAANIRIITWDVIVDGSPWTVDDFNAATIVTYIQARPAEVLTPAYFLFFPGGGPFGAGLQTDMQGFTTPWAVGDILVCEVTVGGNMGFATWEVPDVLGTPVMPNVTDDIIITSGPPIIDWGGGMTGSVDVGTPSAPGAGYGNGLPNEDDLVNPLNVGLFFTLTIDDGAAVVVTICLDLGTLGYSPLNLAYYVNGGWIYEPASGPLSWSGDCVTFTLDPTGADRGGKTKDGNTRANVDIPIVFSNIDGPLPVTLSNFSTAIFENQFVEISWTTESELGNQGWNIYRGLSDNAALVTQLNVGLIEGAGSTMEPTDYNFIDENVENNTSYWYWLESVSNGGETDLHGPSTLTVLFEEDPTPDLPGQTELFGNYPNPFNPDTFINFDVKQDEQATLTIFNTRGQSVMKKTFEPGFYNYSWQADSYPSGVYFYRLETESHTSTKKMLLLK